MNGTNEQVRTAIGEVYQAESRRVFATLVRLLGDFDLAEEALHDAFAAAMKQWPVEGVPANPRAWLVSAGRFKAIDAIRRRSRFDASLDHLAHEHEQRQWAPPDAESQDEAVEDDRLRLIFTCCHPALSMEARTALTLREVCGLTTEEIASAFLTAPSTLAQRIVRAKAKIRDAGIPYQIPSHEDLPDRLDGVLHVIYLVFNEGYAASSGATLTRADLSAEAIRLGRLLVALLPEPEALGLLALMLLHESRRSARATPEGELILLEDQDRTLWNRALIAEGQSLLLRASERAPNGARSASKGAPAPPFLGPYTIQAAIAAVHADAPSAAATDWNQIAELYGLLLQLIPSPVIELNRAVAIAMRDGPESGLKLIEDILARDELADYHLAHSARAEFCRRLGRTEEAAAAYRRALELARQEPERRFLQRRLAELDAPAK